MKDENILWDQINLKLGTKFVVKNKECWKPIYGNNDE